MTDGPILIALGANLPHAGRSPAATLNAALDRLGACGAEPVRVSRFYRTRPVPASAQPDFVNAAAALRTGLAPQALLALLHQIEAEYGRVRGERFAARTLDLDLLAYGGLRSNGPSGPILPHPRVHERAFVLVPLADVAPGWRHPSLNVSIDEMLARLAAADRAAVALLQHDQTTHSKALE